MNQLKKIHQENRQKFFAFIFGVLMKIAGYWLLFSINWKIGLGIMLIERSSELIWNGK
jgi:hypothetical protein